MRLLAEEAGASSKGGGVVVVQAKTWELRRASAEGGCRGGSLRLRLHACESLLKA